MMSRKFSDPIVKTLYNRWKHIAERCTNPKRKDYKYYGAKGVRLAGEWHTFQKFYEWFVDSAFTYAFENQVDFYEVYSIVVVDRIDPSKNYCEENCRLITQTENLKRVVHKKGKRKL